MNIKETFLKLTEYTIPFGHENDLLNILPKNITKDKYGNYYLKIGNSETLFTCHLDTYCDKKQKVNHIIKNNYILTDGKTILGGDNKAGVVTLMYMIHNNVPGLYYFFIGEEPILSGGLYGSRLAAKGYDFSKYKRAIAFDRKQEGSIISRQMARPCCSKEFVDFLIKEFSKSGVSMKNDPTGYYTDTASFLDIIPECTNISIGVYNEHSNKEYIDISYIEKIANAALNIDWENLPTSRNIEEEKYTPVPKNRNRTGKYVKKYIKYNDTKLFDYVSSLLDNYNYICISKHKFESGVVMVFDDWFDSYPFEIIIEDGFIYFENEKFTLKEFEEYLDDIFNYEN